MGNEETTSFLKSECLAQDMTSGVTDVNCFLLLRYA